MFIFTSVSRKTTTVGGQQRVRKQARARAGSSRYGRYTDAHVRAFTNCDWMAAIGARSEGRAGAAAKAATLLWLCCTRHPNTDQNYSSQHGAVLPDSTRRAISPPPGRDGCEGFAPKKLHFVFQAHSLSYKPSHGLRPSRLLQVMGANDRESRQRHWQ